MLIRPTTEADLDQILAWPVTEPAGVVPADRYREELDRGQYRPEWTWVAEDEGRVLARAVWWGFSDAAYPLVLDCVSADGSLPAGGPVSGRAVLAARLIAAGQRALRRPGPSVAPGFEINLPTGWRSDPAVAAAFAWRRDAAARAGLTDELERIRFEWTPGAGLPPSSGRLVFRPEPDDDAFLDVFRQIAVGSLDVITRREVAALGATHQARDDMGIYLAMPGERDWWRLAYTADGGRARRDDPAQPQLRRRGGGVPGRRARDARPRLHRRPGRGDHPVPRRARRTPHRRHDRHHERPHGRGLRARGVPGLGDPVRAVRAARMTRPYAAGGRVRYAGLGYALTVLLTGTNLATPLYAVYEHVFGLSPLDVTLLVAVYAAAVVSALLICGPLADTAGYRPVLVAGLVAAACGSALLAAAAGPGWLFAGRAVQGLAVGTCSGALTAGLVLTEPHGRRARASFLAATATTAAVGFGPVLAGALAQYAPAPRVLSYLVEIALLVPAVAVAALLPGSLGRSGQRWQPRWPSLPAPVRAAFLAPAVVSLLAWAVAYVVLALVPSYAAAALGGSNLFVDGAAAGSLLLVAALAQALCRSWDPARAQASGLAWPGRRPARAHRRGTRHGRAGGQRGGAVRGDGGGGLRAGAGVHGRPAADQRDRPGAGPGRDGLHVLRGDLRGQRAGHRRRRPARHAGRADRVGPVVCGGPRGRVPAHARRAAKPAPRPARRAGPT